MLLGLLRSRVVEPDLLESLIGGWEFSVEFLVHDGPREAWEPRGVEALARRSVVAYYRGTGGDVLLSVNDELCQEGYSRLGRPYE